MWKEIKKFVAELRFTDPNSPFFWVYLILYFFAVLFVIWLIRKLWELAGK